jgi:adenylosuccinate synthase
VSDLSVDVIIGMQHGDEGKGKVTHHLLKEGKYTHCVRYNGGCNAGHTIYHKGEKFVTHHIPAGVFFGIKSIIGPGCVLDIYKFFDEIKMLREAGIDLYEKILIASNVHIIQKKHHKVDSQETRLGTTRTGNGPCYSEKYARTGKRASDYTILEPYLVDLYEEFYLRNPDAKVLCEGAQGVELDIDWGDYPYVTSSHCTAAGACLNGFAPSSIKNVIGVAKAYETYVGSKEFQPEESVFNALQEAGDEYGATTGRKRQCNWINLPALEKAVKMNGVNTLVFNKMDILEKVGAWSVYADHKRYNLFTFQNRDQFCDYIREYFKGVQVFFSGSPEHI